jgi:excisionase family DNA binding protein
VAKLDQVYLSPEQAARYLGVGIDKIKEFMAEGLRYSDLGYRTLRIKVEWLERFVEGRTHAASRQERNEESHQEAQSGLHQ